LKNSICSILGSNSLLFYVDIMVVYHYLLSKFEKQINLMAKFISQQPLLWN